MAALSVQVPYPVFYDRDGQPLDNGNIYIGAANLDPVTNPIQVYFDEALTIPASQPLKTSNGYIYRNGTPTQLYVDATDFSITVNDRKNLLVYNFPDATGIGTQASGITYDPPYVDSVPTTVDAALANVLMRDNFANETDYLAAAATLPTGGFWMDESPQPRHWRLADRVFIDAAAGETNGNKYEGVPPTGTFLTTQMNAFWMERGASTLSVSSYGEFGGVFAARSSDKANSGFYGDATIGVLGIATNDEVVAPNQFVWGGYFESNRDAGANTCFGIELAIKNKGDNIVNYPNLKFPGGSTIGIWLAGGGDASYYGAPTNPSTCAILVGKNSASWNKGIVFASDGITGTDGLTGTGTAIAMAKGHVISWYNNTNSECAAIYSDVDDPAESMSIKFVNDQVQVLSGGSGFVTLMGKNTGVANHIRLFSEASGTGPTIQANGTDTNIDLRLEPKGTGNVSFGTHAGSGDVPITGYIEIKDSGGNVRKLAVIS